MAGTDRNVCITVMCWAKFSVSKLHFVHHLRTYVHKSETLDANRVEKAIQTWWLVYFEYHNTEWSQSQAKIMAVLWCLQNVKKNSCTKITFLLKIYWITGQPRPSNLWDEQQAGNRHTSLLFQAVSFSVWYWYIIFFFFFFLGGEHFAAQVTNVVFCFWIQVYPDRSIQREMKAAFVYCKNKIEGCPGQFRYKDLAVSISELLYCFWYIFCINMCLSATWACTFFCGSFLASMKNLRSLFHDKCLCSCLWFKRTVILAFFGWLCKQGLSNVACW